MEVDSKFSPPPGKEPSALDKPSADGTGNREVENSNYHYENGKCIFTDPDTKHQYEWYEENKEWKPRDSVPTGDYTVVGDTYVYTDKNTNVTYKWDKEENKWEADSVQKEKGVEGAKKKSRKRQEADEEEEEEEEEEEDEDDDDDVDGNAKKKDFKRQDMTNGQYGYENDTHTFTDGTDGTVYVWDKEKNAWFPKVDEDFIAKYQMNYGFVAPPENTEKITEEEKRQKILEALDNNLKRKQPVEPKWFEVEPENNTKVYVSNLPLDITEQEFVDLMQKCGLVMKDVDTGKMKIKLYTEAGTNVLKGDGLCTYIKVESVELALKILDGYEYKGNKISVERAKFTMKGDSYDPSLKPKKKRRKDKEKIKKMQQKLLDWRPDKLRGERMKHERIVIVKNLFEPSVFEKEVTLILEYQQDLREECAKCGDVKKVSIYDRHPEGVAQIIFKEAEAADACVQLLNNRWFGQRQITAETWDGKTKYKIVETQDETKKRLDAWNSFLESNEKAKIEDEEKKCAKDSDQDTRSSAGSDDNTDDEENNTTKKDIPPTE